MTKRKSVTAAELMNRLNSDPEFVAKRTREEEERQKRATEWRKAEQPLVGELQAAGFDVESVSDLFNRKEPWNRKERIRPYPKALPILLKHLERTYPDPVRESIARALAVGRAGWAAAGIDFRFAWVTLARLYREEKGNGGAKHGLAVAISAMAEADNELLDEVIELVKDVRNGESRGLLLGALERSSDPRAKAALMELGTDPELKLEVQAIFRRLERRKR